MPYLTPEAPTDTRCRRFSIPGNWLPYFTGALDELTKLYNWEAFGSMTPQQMVDAFETILNTYTKECSMIGELKYITLADIPDYCALADGSQYYNTDFPEYAAIIDDAYKVGSTKFRVPNMINNFPRGVASAPGVQGGNEQHTLTTAEMPSHGHSYNVPFGEFLAVGPGETPVVLGQIPATTGLTGGGAAFSLLNPHETIKPVIVMRDPETPAPDTGLLISDLFTGTDGTLIQSHTPDINKPGFAWSAPVFIAGDNPPKPLKIQSNQIQMDAPASNSRCYSVIDCEHNDVVISLDIITNDVSTGGQGLIFRHTGSTYYLLNLGPANLVLSKVIAGAGTQVDLHAWTQITDHEYVLTVSAVGSTITIDIDTIHYSVIDASIPAGTEVGFQIFRNTTGNGTRINGIQVRTA